MTTSQGDEMHKCELCGEPMPAGEEMFKLHGYSGPCPKPPLPKPPGIEKTFAHHSPTPETLEKIRGLRRAYSDLLREIDRVVPKSRERSIAVTDLETSAMWAIKGLVCNDPASKVES